MGEIVFLKLGGSLIKDKTQPYTSRPEMLAQVAGEIQSAKSDKADLRLVLGHGSGSFGHYAAKEQLVPYPSPTGDGMEAASAFWSGYAETCSEP
jgi:isopentenyl phosphate kinase